MFKAWGVVLAIVASIAMPATAAAKPGYFVSGLGQHALLRFPGSSGYRIEVQAPMAKKGGLQLVSVTAKKGPAEVTYELQGSLRRDDSLDIHLPHVGRIAVRFDPVHTTRQQLPAGCRGHETVVEHGYFRGRIELQGEREFTTVERDSVHGRVVHSFRRVCKAGKSRRRELLRRKGETTEEPDVSFLVAGREDGTVNFLAALASFSDRTIGPLLRASKTRFRSGMLIASSVLANGKPENLVISESGNSKVVELANPPAPFDGSAVFTLTSPKTSTWEGDLAVELPGAGRVALAGSEFWSIFCAKGKCTKTGGEAGSVIGGVFQVITG